MKIFINSSQFHVIRGKNAFSEQESQTQICLKQILAACHQ